MKETLSDCLLCWGRIRPQRGHCESVCFSRFGQIYLNCEKEANLTCVLVLVKEHQSFLQKINAIKFTKRIEAESCCNGHWVYHPVY